MDKKLLEKIEKLLKSFEGNDKLGELYDYDIDYRKKMNDSECSYGLNATFKTHSKKSFGSMRTIKTYKFKDLRYCFISMKEQLKFEVESLKMKNKLEQKISDVGELGLLQMELQEAIDVEDYEEAEKIKKEIAELKSRKL